MSSREPVGPIARPGDVIGILGGGQLGAMFSQAARRMGYRVEAISDVADCPAARHCDRLHVGDYADTAFLTAAAANLDVVTFEFENVPAAAGAALAAVVPVRPHPDVLHTTQDRAREKAFLERHGFACAPHRVVRSREDLEAAVVALGLPAVLKTAAFGYDGKGQRHVDTPADVAAAWEALASGAGDRTFVLEGWIDFACEASVVAARGLDGAVAAFPTFRNVHRHHILDVSSVPAGLPDRVADAATAITARLLGALDLVGTACVEFFVTKGGEVLVNEIAPRTHNSGHLTIEACETSQFEQQVRAVCGSAARAPSVRRRWPISSATAGAWTPRTVALPRPSSPTGRRRSRCPACDCTSTERPIHAPAARWGTSRRWPTPWTRP